LLIFLKHQGEEQQQNFGINMYQEVWINGKKIKNGARSRKRIPLIEFGKMKGKSVLDIGCSEGMLAIEAKKQGAERVLAIELGDIINTAKEVAKKENLDIEFIQTEAGKWLENCKEKFDYVFFCAMLNHMKDKIKTLRNIDRITDYVLYFETNFENKPEKVMPLVEKYTTFDKYNLVGQTGDRFPEDYHLYVCRRQFEDTERYKKYNHLPIQNIEMKDIHLVLGGLTPDQIAKIQRLKESIEINGLVKPLLVEKKGDIYYVKEGGHRYLALKELKKRTAKCINIVS